MKLVVCNDNILPSIAIHVSKGHAYISSILSHVKIYTGRKGSIAVIKEQADVREAAINWHGVFSRNVEFLLSADPLFVATGDFNADGKPDFVTSNYYGYTDNPNIFTRGSVSVLLNQFDPLQASIFGNVDRESVSLTAGLSAVPLTFRPPAGDPIVKTAYMKAKGAFWVQLPHADYTLHLSAPKSLAQNVPVPAAAGNVHDLNIILYSGDANGDNTVDVNDLAALIEAFDAEPTSPNWHGGVADFNSDNIVDVEDLAILIRNFDREGDY